MSSGFGKHFTITTWGESHGEAIGAVVDGCPAGLALAIQDIQELLNRRRPGFSTFTSKRKEADEVQILSGVFKGITTGTPISLMIKNTDQRPQDYDDLASVFRPGHGDFTYHAKYGHRDFRGGGRASGRETAARVAAGAIAKKLLGVLGVDIDACVCAIGGTEDESKWAALLEEVSVAGDSIGSAASCKISGLKAGFGAPVFDKLTADLAKAMMSIGGATAIEFGTKRADIRRGSENNMLNSNGMLAGISHGGDINFTLTFKPPSSISLPQQAITIDGKPVQITIKGRHDPIIAPRACAVIEAMAAIVVINHIFGRMADRVEYVQNFYNQL